MNWTPGENADHIRILTHWQQSVVSRARPAVRISCLIELLAAELVSCSADRKHLEEGLLVATSGIERAVAYLLRTAAEGGIAGLSPEKVRALAEMARKPPGAGK